jgi:hypothetical protein
MTEEPLPVQSFVQLLLRLDAEVAPSWVLWGDEVPQRLHVLRRLVASLPAPGT